MTVDQERATRMIRQRVAVAGAFVVAIVCGGAGITVGGAVGYSKGYSEGRYEASRAASAATVELMTRGVNGTEGDGAGVKSVLRPFEVTPDLNHVLIKSLVASEVERREQVAVQLRNVTINSPGIARAVFEGGSVDVKFSFTTRDCPDASQAEFQACLDELVRNPMGFKVIDYAAQHEQT